MRADVYLFQSCLPISLLAITANFAASSTPNYKTLTEKFLKAQILSHHVFSGSLVRYNKVLICGIILKILHNLALTDFSCFTFGHAHKCAHTHRQTHTHYLFKLTRLVPAFGHYQSIYHPLMHHWPAFPF